MTSDIERSVAPIQAVLSGNDYWRFEAMETIDRLAGVAEQTGQVDRVARLRLEVARFIGGYELGDKEIAQRALDALVNLAEHVRSGQVF